MITTVTTVVTTTTTTTVTTTTTAVAAMGTQIVGIGIFAIVLLIVFLILRDISMVELKNRTDANNNENSFISSFVNSSVLVIVPLTYVFLSIIIFKIMAVI